MLKNMFKSALSAVKSYARLGYVDVSLGAGRCERRYYESVFSDAQKEASKDAKLFGGKKNIDYNTSDQPVGLKGLTGGYWYFVL
jgi:hypothetical protein